MYVEEIKRVADGKEYSSFVLRESYRDGGKVRKRYIANISHLPRNEIEAIREALRYKNPGVQKQDIQQQIGPSVGALFAVVELCKRLRISEALGPSRQAAFVLWLIFSRLLEQGSRLSSARLAGRHDISLLGLKPFDEDDLYGALDWLAEQQEAVQQTLFKQRKSTELFLYDVSSSYFEGMENELAWWGYNRDGKKGKKQLVFGMLTDDAGMPFAVEVFEGNTADPTTFVQLVKGFGKRFGVEKVTFVGDRGMIKSLGIEALHEEGFNYITAITKPQIRTLLKQGTIQLSLFDEELHEVSGKNIRYVLRRNPVQAAKLESARRDKLENLILAAKKESQYLTSHPKASVDTAIKRLQAIRSKLYMTKVVEIKADNRILTVEPVKAAWEEEATLDGCYVIKTDRMSGLDKESVHARYKDLARVERGFRTIKTGLLEVRPIWLRRKKRTKAHVFVCMLAYMVQRQLHEICEEGETVKDILAELNRITRVDIIIPGEIMPSIPAPPRRAAEILKALKLRLPVVSPIQPPVPKKSGRRRAG
jgi:hypothetical protein